MAENRPHVQARFFTKESKYAVPSTPYSVPADVGGKELNALINGILQDGAADVSTVDFDFLIDGEFIRVNLNKHLESKSISVETIVEIEYVEKHPAPKPQDSLLHNDWVSCVEGSHGWILSGCYDNTVHLWTAEGDPVMTIPGHSAPVKAVRWIDTDNGRNSSFLSASHDQTIHIWKWNNEKKEVDCVHACRGHAASVDCLAVDPTKQHFCSGSWDRMLKLWSAVASADVEDEDEEEEEVPRKKKKTSKKVQTRVPVVTLSGHGEGVSGVNWMNATDVCTVSWDHTIRIWDVQQATQKSLLQGSKVFLGVSYSPLNGLIVTASADRHVRLWDPRISDGTMVKCTYTSHSGWVSGVMWSQTDDHLFISGSYDNVMKLWDTRSPKTPLYNMTGHEEKILAVDWSIPNLMLSGAADNHLKLFQYKDVGR